MAHRRSAPTVTIHITRMIAHHTAITARIGSLVEFSSEPVRGMAGADEVGVAAALEAASTAIEVSVAASVGAADSVHAEASSTAETVSAVVMAFAEGPVVAADLVEADSTVAVGFMEAVDFMAVEASTEAAGPMEAAIGN